jgi:outer membrane biosynthesis protein TonB
VINFASCADIFSQIFVKLFKLIYINTIGIALLYLCKTKTQRGWGTSMQKLKTYDYRNTFFKRPIWTPSNVLFGKILMITFITLISVTAFFATAYRYSTPTLKPHVRDRIIARIAPKEPINNVMLASSSNDPKTMSSIIAEMNQSDEETVVSATEQPKPRIRREVPLTPAPVIEDEPKSLEEALSRVKTPAPKPVKAEPVPITPLEELRVTKKQYQKVERELTKKDDRPITVSGGNFTDFGVITGYRDEEETMAVTMQNQRRVRHCIDKVYRTYGNVKGYIAIKYTIHPLGYVIPESVKVVESTIPNPEIAQCIVRSVRNWRNFKSIPIEMGNYTVYQKFVF